MSLGPRLLLTTILGVTSVSSLALRIASSPQNYERTLVSGVAGILLLVAYFASVAGILVKVRGV